MSKEPRKSRFEATQQTVKFFETLLRASADGILITDATNNILVTNEAFCDFFGRRWQDVIGTSLFVWLEQLDAGALHRWTDLEKKVFFNELCHNVEFHMTAKEDTRDLSVNASLMEWVGEEENGVIVSIWRDITKRKQAERALQKAHDDLEKRVEMRTAELMKANKRLEEGLEERKRAEEALRQSEERLQAIFKAAENVSFLLARVIDDQDNDPTVIEFSPGAEKILGYKREEVLGKPVSILHLPEDTEQFIEMHRNMRQGRMGFNGEVTLTRKSGDKFPALLSTHPLFDDKGTMYAALGVSLDVSKQKQLEAQIRQTQKMESLGTLAGGIAHEFNNILGIIVGNTELAMDDVPEWNRAHYNLEEIRTACLRARDVVRQVLAFTRQTQPELKPVRINSIVKETLKLVRSLIPATIEIRQQISSKGDTINADATQINQILLNLCSNAAFAMKDKGGVLTIGLKNVELDKGDVAQYHNINPGTYVKLTVNDTGCGIKPEIRDRIFDPYFTTREVGEGSGMGLALVHGIINTHGGAITVHSEPDRGSTFNVLFPVIEDEIKPQTDSPDTTPKGNERVLFVDDEESLVFAAEQTLGKLGYDVVGEKKPLKALEIFMKQPDRFDIVITDMSMPHMRGDSFAKEIMKIRPDIPVILCSGNSELISEEKVKEMGIRAFVMKPALVREIAETIRQVLI